MTPCILKTLQGLAERPCWKALFAVLWPVVKMSTQTLRCKRGKCGGDFDGNPQKAAKLEDLLKPVELPGDESVDDAFSIMQEVIPHVPRLQSQSCTIRMT